MKATPSNFTYVFVEKFPFAVENESVFPKERQREIESCTNSAVKEQKFFVWKLLERSLQTLGIKMEELDLHRDENGKWVSPLCHISLTHSGNFVGVAVSNEPVGVDIEKRDESRFSKHFAQKILTESEKELFTSLKEESRGAFLNCLWTKKEAIFKLSGGKAFVPKNIEGRAFPSQTKTFKEGNSEYFITVACSNPQGASFYAPDIEFINFDNI